MKVILPCCGRSSRYPSLAPKWMLPGPDGRPMLTMAVGQLPVDPDDLVVVILREHDERYGATAGIREAFGHDVRTVVLDEPTSSQAETVSLAVDRLELDEPFFVKDSDSTFELPDLDRSYNYVSVDSLNNHDLINPRNKSYVQVDHNNVITNIREKEVISDLFSVGGYYFADVDAFRAHYAVLSKAAEWERELYLSDIISAMILDGTPFRAEPVKHYQDWGTVHEWRRTLRARRTFFVALDGFVFERGSEHFDPRFEAVAPNQGAVEVVQSLTERGHSVVFLSIRPPRLEEVTARQLADVGLGGSQVVYGCPIASWTLVGSPHPSLPLRTVEAVELAADDPNLEEKLSDL